MKEALRAYPIGSKELHASPSGLQLVIALEHRRTQIVEQEDVSTQAVVGLDNLTRGWWTRIYNGGGGEERD